MKDESKPKHIPMTKYQSLPKPPSHISAQRTSPTPSPWIDSHFHLHFQSTTTIQDVPKLPSFEVFTGWKSQLSFTASHLFCIILHTAINALQGSNTSPTHLYSRVHHFTSLSTAHLMEYTPSHPAHRVSYILARSAWRGHIAFCFVLEDIPQLTRCLLSWIGKRRWRPFVWPHLSWSDFASTPNFFLLGWTGSTARAGGCWLKHTTRNRGWIEWCCRSFDRWTCN